MANPAGKAILTVLSVFSSIVGFTSFLPNEFPNKEIHMFDRQHQAQDSMVRVVIALNGVQELTEADGPIPAVVAFDENKKFEDSGISDLADTLIFGSRRRRDRADKLHTYRSWATMMVSVLPTFLNSGEMVRQEGDCTWLNRDASSDGSDNLQHIEAAAMQIHMEAFTNFTADYNADPAFYCKEPAMLFRRKFSYELNHDHYELDGLPDPGRIHFWYAKDADSMPRKKRHQPARASSKFDGRLITSIHAQHSARELCKSDLSFGPNFVSYSENVFCYMETKESWPLCDDGQMKDERYDMATHALLTRSGHAKRNHVRVENWD